MRWRFGRLRKGNREAANEKRNRERQPAGESGEKPRRGIRTFVGWLRAHVGQPASPQSTVPICERKPREVVPFPLLTNGS